MKKLQVNEMELELRDEISAQDFYKMRHSVNWKDVKNLNQLDKALSNSMIVVGIYDHDEIVAMGRLVGDYSFKALLSDIIVKSEYQQKGYGKIIVQQILKQAKEKMNVGDLLCIEGSPTNGNMEFYRKCGFHHKPEIQDGIYIWLEK